MDTFCPRTLRFRVSQFFQKSWLYGLTLRGKGPRNIMVLPPDSWPGNAQMGQNLLSGGYIIQGRFIPLSEFVACLEDYRTFPEEVIANIHSFEWLRDLKTAGHNISRKMARQLIIEWISKNQAWSQKYWKSIPWRLDILGYRIANWIALYDFFGASGDETFKSIFFNSLHKQIKFLKRVYFTSPKPDARFKAIKGLLFSGAFEKLGPEDLGKALNDLKLASHSLFNRDGGHLSGNPFLQFLSIRDLIDIRSIIKTTTQLEPEFLTEVIHKTTPILRLFRMGDGGLSNFKGNISPEELGFCPQEITPSLLDMALSLSDTKGKPAIKAPETGYERLMNKSGLVIINSKPRLIPSGYEGLEPGLSVLDFEWSQGKNRLVTVGDTIIQTKDSKWLSLKPQEGLLTSKKSTKTGDIIWEGDYDQRVKEILFRHQRQLFLSALGGDFRGQDTLTLNTEAMIAIRFIVAPNLVVDESSSSKHLVLNLINSEETPEKIELKFRFLFSGCDEIIVVPSEQNIPSSIFMIHQIKPNQTWISKWAFRAESL
jgi:uncharacterized heparinase superfamily protein